MRPRRAALLVLLAATAGLAAATGHGAAQAGASGKAEAAMPGDETAVPEALWRSAVGQVPAPPPRIVIEGIEGPEGFEPGVARLVSRAAEPARRRMAPFATELLDGLAPRRFGVEERAFARRAGGGFELRCETGTAPAGFVLGGEEFYLPRGIDARLVLSAEGDEGFGVSLVAPGEDAPDRPHSFLRPGRSGLDLPTPEWSAVPAAHDIVISCPPGAATTRLRSVRIEATPVPARAPDAVGTWIWDASTWLDQPKALVAWAREAGIDRIYLQLPVSGTGVQHAAALSSLVGLLAADGIAVHAVEGDPAMVTPEGRAHALARLGAIGAYQTSAEPGARLAGVQYDIEPYLLPGHADDPARSWEAWSATMRALAATWGGAIGAVLPFWMLETGHGAEALATAAADISEITVMAYRTEVDEIVATAEPWLAWGASADRRIRVAVENGRLPTEIHRTYLRAESGEVRLSRQDGESTVELLPVSVAADADTAVYQFSHAVRVEPGRISFLNDAPRLAAARSKLNSFLTAWKSFAGLTIHELGGDR